MMKMRIKKYFLLCFLPVIVVLCFVFLAPAFANMKKVDEVELARLNASVTGASVKDPVASFDKDTVRQETWQTTETLNKENTDFPPVVSKDERIGVDMNINGQRTFQLYRGATNINMMGGTSVIPR